MWCRTPAAVPSLKKVSRGGGEKVHCLLPVQRLDAGHVNHRVRTLKCLDQSVAGHHVHAAGAGETDYLLATRPGNSHNVATNGSGSSCNGDVHAPNSMTHNPRSAGRGRRLGDMEATDTMGTQCCAGHTLLPTLNNGWPEARPQAAASRPPRLQRRSHAKKVCFALTEKLSILVRLDLDHAKAHVLAKGHVTIHSIQALLRCGEARQRPEA